MSVQRNDLTDEEKYFLLELSYVDLNSVVDYRKENMNILQVLNDAWDVRSMETEQRDKIKDLIDKYNELSQKHGGLEDIRVIGYENHNRTGDTTHDTQSGFVGYALEDASGNRGFLFRGSETDSLVDWTD
ncbi:hypothetical protein ACFFT4_19625, partial [Cohnella cellulosilytica]